MISPRGDKDNNTFLMAIQYLQFDVVSYLGEDLRLRSKVV
jgi:hypothetical protein